MLWSKNLLSGLAFWCLVASMPASVSLAGIGCPPTYEGKPLKDVELFDGPPVNKIEVMPEIGRFVIPQRPSSMWEKYPPPTLGCTYYGTREIVPMVLPHEFKVCDFTDGPQVSCH